jgi:hypothetical protein
LFDALATPSATFLGPPDLPCPDAHRCQPRRSPAFAQRLIAAGWDLARRATTLKQGSNQKPEAHRPGKSNEHDRNMPGTPKNDFIED